MSIEIKHEHDAQAKGQSWIVLLAEKLFGRRGGLVAFVAHLALLFILFAVNTGIAPRWLTDSLVCLGFIFITIQYSKPYRKHLSYSVYWCGLILFWLFFALFVAYTRFHDTPNLHLTFVRSPNNAVQFSIVNSNPSVIAETPQIVGVGYSREDPVFVYEHPFDRREVLPQFVRDVQGPFRLFGDVIDFSKYEYDQEIGWQRHYAYISVTCKNCPDTKHYWVGLADTFWFTEFELPPTFHRDSLKTEPLDRYIDSIIPVDTRTPILVR